METLTTEAKQQKKPLWIALVGAFIVLVAITAGILITNSHLAKTPYEEPAWAGIIRSNYGAESAYYAGGWMFITIDGKTERCIPATPKQLETRAPIKCTNDTMVEAR